jgi:ATP-dependent 26S proteasome regulatory subunit
LSSILFRNNFLFKNTKQTKIEMTEKDDFDQDILKLSTDDIISRSRLLENEIKILRSEIMRIAHEHQSQKEKIKENKEKIKLNKTLPYLVSNVIEVGYFLLILQDKKILIHLK